MKLQCAQGDLANLQMNDSLESKLVREDAECTHKSYEKCEFDQDVLPSDDETEVEPPAAYCRRYEKTNDSDNLP